MKLFACQGCGNPVHFDNSACVACGRALGVLPDIMSVTALEPDGDAFRTLVEPSTRVFRCDNAALDACNWLVPEAEGPGLCVACRHNRTIPDLSVPDHLAGWQRLETAKKHLFYSLARWGIHTPNKAQDPEGGLAFDFIADMPEPDGSMKRAMTGHAAGVITISISETDDAERERRRAGLREPYRTLLGHLRHEVGHYVWDRLVATDAARLQDSRRIFGDERADYGAALEAHYANGAPPDWSLWAVSAYATAHPFEDFAETFAHYVHMVDGLETARAFGLVVRPRIGGGGSLDAVVDFDPYRARDIEEIVDAWVPFTVALNAMNRSLGQPDLYPFVLSAPVTGKLGFVHRLVRGLA